MICLIDQRYGHPLDAFGYKGKSATHVEIEHARNLGLPIRYFIRKQAFVEHGLMRKDPTSFESAWVEAGYEKGTQRKRWFDFVNECKKPPSDNHSNNWFDQFDTSVDLKCMVERRIRSVFR